jgi:predicted amidohydrolase YtcJ
VVAVGSPAAVRAALGARARVIDCAGATVLAGLIDPHLHLFGLATRAAHLDLAGCRRARDVLAVVRRRARTLAPGAWVRGEGLDEHGLDRLPQAAELDAAAPRNPVRLRHRSRHASVLSGRALARLARRGLSPADAQGLVVGHEAAISRAMGALPSRTLERGLAAAGASLLALGVTTVCDASPRARADWTPLVRLARGGRFVPRVVAMRAPGVRPWPAGRVTAGPVKILVDESPAGMTPSPERIARLVSQAARRGDAVAVHCVGAATLAAALAAFAALPAALRQRAHRLEHVAECPPPLVREIARLGLTVVTNPAFVYWRGDVYRHETAPAQRAWLYRARTLGAAGVTLAAGSDAPIVPPDPWRTMAAARTRRTRAGRPLGVAERLDARAALALVTTGAAAALGVPALGRLDPGCAADAIVVAGDPLACAPDAVAHMRPRLTVLGGRIAWEA